MVIRFNKCGSIRSPCKENPLFNKKPFENYFSCKHLAIFWLIFCCPSFTSLVFFFRREISSYVEFKNLRTSWKQFKNLRTAYRGNFRTWVLDTRKRLDRNEQISNNYQSSKNDVNWIPRVSRPMYRQRGILCVISSIRLKVFLPCILNFFVWASRKKLLSEIKSKRLSWAAEFERSDMGFQWTARQL